MPAATKHLGTDLLDCDVEKGWVRLSFEPKPEFVNPHGGIQGGFISAMLDECFSFAAFIHMKGAFRTPTIEMTTQFINHAKIETLHGEGRVVKAGRSVVFSEASLFRADGKLCAKATASTLLVPMSQS